MMGLYIDDVRSDDDGKLGDLKVCEHGRGVCKISVCVRCCCWKNIPVVSLFVEVQ
jgi:hypothetical protein